MTTSKPMVHHMPRIAEFLGYNPLSLDDTSLAWQIKSYRIQKRLSHKKLGKILGVDASTIGAWEKNETISKKHLSRLHKLFSDQTTLTQKNH